MSARLLRRVLQEREAAPQDPEVAEDEQPEEEDASPPRAAARNLFDLLDGGDDEEEDKVRSSWSLMIISLGFRSTSSNRPIVLSSYLVVSYVIMRQW